MLRRSTTLDPQVHRHHLVRRTMMRRFRLLQWSPRLLRQDHRHHLVWRTSKTQAPLALPQLPSPARGTSKNISCLHRPDMRNQMISRKCLSVLPSRSYIKPTMPILPPSQILTPPLPTMTHLQLPRLPSFWLPLRRRDATAHRQPPLGPLWHIRGIL